MDSNKDFINRLKAGKKRILKVGIIDDNSDVLKDQILKQVNCEIAEYSLEKIMRYYNDKMRRCVLAGYDIIFWDASLSDDTGLSATSILEELIEFDPQFANKSKVIVGNDLIQYARSSDLKTRILIERALRLPHIIYGKEHGTKVDNMLYYMKKEASNKNIELPVRMQTGICRKEILDKIEPYIKLISQNLHEQARIGFDIESDFKDFQPNNEDEKQLLENIHKMSSLFIYNQHLIVQLYHALNIGLDLGRQQKAIYDDEEKQQ